MKKKVKGPIQIVDGAWYATAFRTKDEPESDPFTEECCDCGLVHRVEYKVENGKFWVRYIIDKEATAEARARRSSAAPPRRSRSTRRE
jgi:hypothetical protein